MEPIKQLVAKYKGGFKLADMKSVLDRIAYLLGRIENYSTGNSTTMPWWCQSVKGIKGLRYWHIKTCKLCDREILKLSKKEGWASKYGVKENFILCPWCYDKYKVEKR
jgi:uncharacterized protein with PIN domain